MTPNEKRAAYEARQRKVAQRSGQTVEAVPDEDKSIATQFKPGQSGNPIGRPVQPKTPAEVRALARQHTVGAIETLVRVHKNPKAPWACRVTAAEALLSRGWGKPLSEIGEGGESLVIKVVRFADEQVEAPEIKVIEHREDE